MFDALKRYVIHTPTQREKLPGQVKNNAGGFSYQADNWTQLVRFLILGTTGGSFYIGERDLTKMNVSAVDQCIDEDALRVVDIVKEVSLAGRAAKNDPALFVLAMVASRQVQVEARGKIITIPSAGAKAAYQAIPDVARTFTHLSRFVTFIRKGKMRGWGRGFRKAVARWFTAKSVEDLSYQAIKYRSRDGFTQKDVAWLCHAASFLTKDDAARRAIFNYLDYRAKAGAPELVLSEADQACLRLITAAQALHQVKDDQQAAALVRKYDMPIEAVPTEFRGKAVYEAVAASAKTGWLLRNLGNLGKVGLLSSNETQFVKGVVAKLNNANAIKKARLHPLAILVALNTYKGGKGLKGGGTWEVVPKVIDALDEAFYASFRFVEPSGKRMLIAIDVSGSKSYPLNVSAKQRVDDVMQTITRIGGGGTDCALPFIYAMEKKLKIDLFVCLTDSETWAGKQHVMPALQAYRHASGVNARAINIAMTANRVSNFNADPLCLEISGFDTTIPEVITMFSKESDS